MKRFLFVALAAAALGSSSGCCRGWFIWPGHYPHNPSFSQCCEPPWGPPDPFGGRNGRQDSWGRGPSEGDCYYSSQGLGDLFACDCGCQGAGAHGYPPAGGMQPGRGYGGAPGMYGPPLSPEGIPLQPAPDAMSAGQVAYPYYTNRGPRDFLMGYPPGRQPPSIGP